MTTLTPDAEGLFLSLRRPLSSLAGAAIPAVSEPFDVDNELAVYRAALNKALSRVPGQHVDSLRNLALQLRKNAKAEDDRRGYKRQAEILFDHMVSRGLKSAGPVRTHEADPAIEFLAIRTAVYSLLMTIVTDDQLIQSNQSATEGWMAVADPETTDRAEAVGYHALRAESRLYMEVMDNNGTTERFMAKQQGRMH